MNMSFEKKLDQVKELESILGMKLEKGSRDDTAKIDIYVSVDNMSFSVIFLSEMFKGKKIIDKDKNGNPIDSKEISVFCWLGLVRDIDQKLDWEKKAISYISKEIADSIMEKQPVINKGFKLTTDTISDFKRTLKIVELDLTEQEIKEIIDSKTKINKTKK